MKKPNAWYQTIVAHLHEPGGPLLVDQIWRRMEVAGFRHSSKMPRSTCGARIVELVQLRKLEHVAPKTYPLLSDTQGEVVSP